MSLWIGIVLGIIFAAIGFRRSLYSTWPVLFNVCVSIYLGIMLSPTIAKAIPAINESKHVFYIYGGLIAGVAIAAFAILQTIAYLFFTGTFQVTLPAGVDRLLSTLFGFGIGFLIANFLCFAVCVTPINDSSFMKDYCQGQKMADSANPAMTYLCNTVGAVSLQNKQSAPDEIIGWLSSAKYGGPDAAKNHENKKSDSTDSTASEPNQIEPEPNSSPAAEPNI